MHCTDKLHHKTQREALNHLAWAKKQPGGHGIKHLNAYECPCGGGWCVGRAWRSKREAEAAEPAAPAAPAPKQPTPGQQRRADKKAAEKLVRQEFFRDYHETLLFCRMLVERETARYEALGIKPRGPSAGQPH
jgi:hypothetical protein